MEACLEDLGELAAQIGSYQHGLVEHLASLGDLIRGHLWVTPEFVGPATESLGKSKAAVAVLASRVQRLRKGYENLPQEEAAETAGAARPPTTPKTPAKRRTS